MAAPSAASRPSVTQARWTELWEARITTIKSLVARDRQPEPRLPNRAALIVNWNTRSIIACMTGTFAELHCHSNFSFLDGASSVEDLVERAVELGLTGLALTDHNGLYGAVRFATAARDAGLRPIVGMEIELLDPAVTDPAGVVVPRRRQRKVRGQSVALEDVAYRPGCPLAVGWSGHPSNASGRRVIGSRDARICAASDRASSARISSSSRAT